MIDVLINRLALTQLAYCNSRFCFIKITKPAHEHHLQAPTLLQALTPVFHDNLAFSINTAANLKIFIFDI